jgi:dienelactone hydrolase
MLALDSARHGADTTAPRPVQITVWYPAQRSSSARVTYGEYFDLSASEREPATDSAKGAARAGYRAFVVEHGLADSVFTRWLATPMLAVRDAAPLASRRPLIVLVNGNGQSAQDQSTLGEYLASHGYVVATSPSYTRISRPPESEGELGSGAEEQADDIAFVVARLRTRADVDTAKLGLVAHSLGARGALLYQMRSGAARALVSLDGGIGTATGRAAMEQAKSFDATRLTIPVLHVYERLDAFMTPDFTMLKELTGAPVWLAGTHDMHHIHFTSLGAWGARVPAVGALDYLIDVEHEELEQRELLRGERDRLAGARDATRSEVDDEVVDRHRFGDERRSPAGERPHAREELAERERLGEVVVSAGVESRHAIVERVARGEHEDWSRELALAELTADIEPRSAWQHDVEDDDVEGA